ncbi:Ctr copper transporter [Mycena rosella]|uniref:Copper transport protein n=1 Tax=Mycena rosella TaxID=1033263 RepID=A0AAD7DAL5_MYCRO|nr:Ctr copper transporter [Mycena rosella]
MNMTDSASSTSIDSGMGMMKAYLHFTPGDTLLFAGITPTSPGAVLGACLVFFAVSVAERWLRAAARGAEARFAQRSKRLVSYAFDSTADTYPAGKDSAPQVDASSKHFVLSHELSRGVLAGMQTTLHYLLMLVVMTFNAALIISVILGVIVGETAFGRLNYH